MQLKQAQINAKTCNAPCKHRQKRPAGGFTGSCVCTIDNKEIGWHAVTWYCPAGLYPFVGLGTFIARWLWRLRIPQALRMIRLFNPVRCQCAKRQAKMNRLGKRIARLFGRGSE